MKRAGHLNTPWRLLLGMAFLALVPQAHALDLLESYQAALSEDADYRAAQAQALANREVVPMALAQLYPNISGSYNHYRNDLNTRNKYQSAYESVYPSSNLALTLRQPLYRPVQFAGYQQSKAKLEGVEAILEKAQQDTALRVSSAYFNVQLAKENLSVVLSQKDAIANQLLAAKKAFSAGAGARTDIDDAQARLDLNLAQEITARQQIEQSQHLLSIVINRPVQTIHALQVDRLPLLPMAPDVLEVWLDRADTASPDLRNLRSEVDAARMDMEQAKAGHMPTLDLIVQRSRNASDNVVNPDARYINNQIGVQASLPLYAGGYVTAQVRSAMASLTESEERLEAARRKLAADVRKQFQAVKEGVAKVRALEQAERSADQAVLSSQKGFKAGTRSRLDILNAEQQRSQTRMDLAKERINFVMARLQLLALSGGLNLAEITQVNGWLSDQQREAPAPVPVASLAMPSPENRPAQAPAQDQVPAVDKPLIKPASLDTPSLERVRAKQDVSTAIDHWLEAWRRKDLKTYFASYAAEFSPQNHRSRKAWEKSKKAFIGDNQEAIQVAISSLDIQVKNDTATAKFYQEYRSGKVISKTQKILTLTRKDEKWLIKEERLL